MSDDLRMEERRAAARQLTCIPAYVGGKEDSPHLALIHDVSPGGARLFTRTKFALEDAVQLSLYLLPENETPRIASGRVVRVERRATDRADMWQWEIGVRFDEPITAYEREIEELCERQRRIGVLRN